MANPTGANQVLTKIYQALTNAIRVYVVNSDQGGLINSDGFSEASVGPASIPVSGLTEVLPVNLNRLYAHVINNTQVTVYVQYAVDAVVGEGFLLEPGGVLTISGFELWKGRVSAISATPTDIEVMEAEA